jgi:hypothetical protein
MLALATEKGRQKKLAPKRPTPPPLVVERVA